MSIKLPVPATLSMLSPAGRAIMYTAEKLQQLKDKRDRAIATLEACRIPDGVGYKSLTSKQYAALIHYADEYGFRKKKDEKDIMRAGAFMERLRREARITLV